MYLGNNVYEITLQNGQVVKMSKEDMENISKILEKENKEEKNQGSLFN